MQPTYGVSRSHVSGGGRAGVEQQRCSAERPSHETAARLYRKAVRMDVLVYSYMYVCMYVWMDVSKYA